MICFLGLFCGHFLLPVLQNRLMANRNLEKGVIMSFLQFSIYLFIYSCSVIVPNIFLLFSGILCSLI